MSLLFLHGSDTGSVSMDQCRTIIAESGLTITDSVDDLKREDKPGIVAELTNPDSEVVANLVSATREIGKKALVLADRKNYTWKGVPELQGMEHIWVVRYSHEMTAYSALRVYLTTYCGGELQAAGTRLQLDEGQDRWG